MKRVTISMQDSAYERIALHAEQKGISFSKACANLALIGEKSQPTEYLSSSIAEYLVANNVGFYMIGNFDLPASVLKRAIAHSISGSAEESPLVEFAEIVGA